ncbi:hypothetical protein F5B18DRAFT_608001 [Nemania serpens]|nr:hypothetical protein F5B18DRAFT_608001 [Nemania serpens]
MGALGLWVLGVWVGPSTPMRGALCRFAVRHKNRRLRDWMAGVTNIFNSSRDSTQSNALGGSQYNNTGAACRACESPTHRLGWAEAHLTPNLPKF